jgi:four helix bundle protein
MTTAQPVARAQRFDELHVYKCARELTKAIYSVTKRPPFSRDFGLRDQIRRASVSVMSNIAEGFERGSNTEFIQFLYIAKGSCGEIRAQLVVALDQEYLTAEEYEALDDLSRKTGSMLSNFITYLKNSKMRGEKYA